jgi:hypothetical protein
MGLPQLWISSLYILQTLEYRSLGKLIKSVYHNSQFFFTKVFITILKVTYIKYYKFS